MLRSYTLEDVLYHQVMISNPGSRPKHCRLAIAVRPYNPEGVSLIGDLAYHNGDRVLRVNGRQEVRFSSAPDGLWFSTHAEGDCAGMLGKDIRKPDDHSVQCQKGLANGFVSYDIELPGHDSKTVECSLPLAGKSASIHRMDRSTAAHASGAWRRLLAEGARLETPDPRINAFLSMSKATLLMLTDGASITPGPFTYHQFWFRDAAYMLWALDKFGFARHTRPIVRSFSARQERSGYFRSQQGEWDSNGQAIWTVWQHALLVKDTEILETHFESLRKGVEWIAKNRLTGTQHRLTSHAGLLPEGLSAEHLGLSDFYFWDDFWSLAGVDAFRRICRLLGREQEGNGARTLFTDLQSDVERAIKGTQERIGTEAIPAGPARGLDVGMIGSASASYPLQLMQAGDGRMSATLRILEQRFFHDGMFYQNFIHSGMNAYLSLHVAHARLYAGDRARFWKHLTAVFDHGSDTFTFPEAIHPLTGGGSMGDGHHGWAAAEILLAIRDAIVYERWHPDVDLHDLILLAGVPAGWLSAGKRFSLMGVPVPEGTMDIDVSSKGQNLSLHIRFERSGSVAGGRWILALPVAVRDIRLGSREIEASRQSRNRTVVELPQGQSEIDLKARIVSRVHD
jgi:hypothetical protein